MTAKVIDIKSIIPDANSGKATQPSTKAEALKYFRETKPSAEKKSAVIDTVEEQIKLVDSLESEGDFKVLPKDESEAGSGLSELLGNVNVTFSPKAKKAWLDVISTLSDNLRNSEPKSKALIFKPEGTKIVETLFQLISIKSEDDDENLSPVQRQARDLLMDALNSSPSGSIDISSRDYMVGMISGNPKESIRATVDLIRSESLNKLTKKDSGFIANVGGSYGKLGKALSNFVFNKIQALTTRPLSMTEDDDSLGDVKDEISTFKDDVFQETANGIREDFEKQKARLKLKSEDEDFVEKFLDLAKNVFIAVDPSSAEEESIKLTKLMTEKTSRVLDATATIEASDATRNLLTKAINSASSRESIVDIDRKYIDQDPSKKDVLNKAWYDQIVTESTKITNNIVTMSSDPTRAELQKLIEDLANKSKSSSGTVEIKSYLPANHSLKNTNLNEEQLMEILKKAIDPDGKIIPAADFTTKVKGALQDNASDYASAIIQKLKDDNNAKNIESIKKADLIVAIEANGSLSSDQKINLVLNGGTYNRNGNNCTVEAQGSWKMLVSSSSKSNVEIIRANVDAVKTQAKKDKEYYSKFLENMNKSIFVPIMSKASTISATLLNALKDSMSDENGNLKEEFKESFSGLHDAAKARIDAKAKQAKSDLETLELSAQSSVIKSRDQALISLGSYNNFNSFIQKVTGVNSGTTARLMSDFIEKFKRSEGNKTGVNLSESEIQTLEASFDSSLTPFELARKELERIQIISSKILQLKQALSRKPDLITSLTSQTHKTYFNLVNSSSFLNSLTDSNIKAIGTQLTKLKTDYFKKIDDLKKQSDTLEALVTKSDIWELLTDNDVDKSAIRDIIRDLQNGLKDSLKSILRSLGLMTPENMESLKKRVDAIDPGTEQTGFLAPLQSALVGITSSSGVSAKSDSGSSQKPESQPTA
jgi:hypothetical protein